MERHTNNLQTTFLGLCQENEPMLRRCTELARQAKQTARIIGDDSHDVLNLLAHQRTLLHLGHIIVKLELNNNEGTGA